VAVATQLLVVVAAEPATTLGLHITVVLVVEQAVQELQVQVLEVEQQP
jgi:hypothetical protein